MTRTGAIAWWHIFALVTGHFTSGVDTRLVLLTTGSYCAESILTFSPLAMLRGRRLR